MQHLILAVVGLAGSGKTESAEYLKKVTGWPSVHFGNTVVSEVQRRGLPVNQTNEKLVRDELRSTHGMAAMAIINKDTVETLYQKGSVIIESLYSWEEYMVMRQLFGQSFRVVSIMACFEIRTKRLEQRPFRPLTRAELEQRDASQIETLHQAGPIARADYVVINEGTTQELHTHLDEVIKKLGVENLHAKIS